MVERLTDIEFLLNRELNISDLISSPGELPFSDRAIEYLDNLAEILNEDQEAKKYPEIVTFAFFCRKGNLLHLKKKYLNENFLRLGRGLVFHIAPANMPVTFAYSLVFGIVSGNLNIVKVSSKKFRQAEIICHALSELSKRPEHQSFSERQIVISCKTDSFAVSYFSSICDVRIIWGGNDTIEEIRKNQLQPHAFDVTFADRYSLCIINADKFINEKSPGQIASGFYNDTYLFDQNACSSPHLIVWLGSDKNVENSKLVFWNHVYDIVKSKYQLHPHSSVDKLSTFFNHAIHSEGIKKSDSHDNLIWRTELREVPKNIDNYHCYGGYFSECKASSLQEISKIFNKKFQTLSYYGLERDALIRFVSQHEPIGIDRVIPIGRTTEFSLSHDGFNLIETLSREIELV